MTDKQDHAATEAHLTAAVRHLTTALAHASRALSIHRGPGYVSPSDGVEWDEMSWEQHLACLVARIEEGVLG